MTNPESGGRNRNDVIEVALPASELRQILENLKCCGNCGLFSDNECMYFQRTVPYHYCDKWQSDNMTRKEREG